MLSRLIIKNIALINEIEISLCEGMNVLSGETGAGKSIIVDSVNLVLGERADRELIRTGCQNASVEAWFENAPQAVCDILASQQIEYEGELVLSRELSASGKNVCRVNGVLVTLSLLKEISDLLVDIHGQHEHQSLFDEKNHITMLDGFDVRIDEAKAQVKAAFIDYTEAARRLKSLFGAAGDRERRIDILRFQIDEIQKANIKEGEEEELLLRKKRMNASEEIMESLNSAYESLYASEDFNALSALKDISVKLSGLGRIDEKYERMASTVNDAYYTLEETASCLRKEMDELSFDPNELEEVEERLLLISNLKRKYQDPCVTGEYIKKAEQELSDLVNSEALAEKLTAEVKRQKIALYEKSVALSNLRREAAAAFEHKMKKQLADLGMTAASFSVKFSDIASIDECAFSENGIDSAEFYISANAGEPEKPLKKVASGGEVSRIMLAIKNIAADRGGIPTVIFDEIDTGISGRMAQVVAEKLQTISRSRQVLCVTHLPQIACMGDRHFLVSKESDGKTTNTYISELSGEERVSEIARLSGGDSDVAKDHAREMLIRAKNFKTST
ncbi:MAG: DNA repair protein RecN [Burkholderiales bacterium]